MPHRHDHKHILWYLLVDLAFRARLISNQEMLDVLITEKYTKIRRLLLPAKELLTEREVCERYPFFTQKQLQNWRYRQRGIQYIKTGNSRNSRILYQVSDIESFLREHKKLPS